MKKIFFVSILMVSGFINAQNFQGMAVYESKTSTSDMTSNFRGNREITPEMQKQIEERMKAMFEKTFVLTFDKNASTYVEEEKIDDEQDCVYFNDECLTKEEYLELLWTKLVDFDSYLAYETLFDITNEKLTLDEKIIEIESKIVDVFLREYEEQSIHDFLKEKIIEKVLID